MTWTPVSDSSTFNDLSYNNFATKFDRRAQFIRLASWGLLRFLVTLTLIFSLYGTIIGFVRHGLIGEVGKRVYNTLFTGLSMTLGIAIASSFKAIAVNLRWYILSRKKRPIEEVNTCPSSPNEVLTLAGQCYFGM
jgi:hypothetical protein